MIFSWCPWTRAVRRGRENAAAVAARALRAAPARSETAARHALERDRESLVEREKLLSKQLSRRETTGWSGWSELVRQAEALAAGWSDDETTSDRRGLGLGLVVKREFAPNADARETARETNEKARTQDDVGRDAGEVGRGDGAGRATRPMSAMRRYERSVSGSGKLCFQMRSRLSNSSLEDRSFAMFVKRSTSRRRDINRRRRVRR